MPDMINSSGAGASGVVSLPVVGLVTDNVDPEELGRIKVKFPNLHAAPESYWLRQASPNAGKERGLYALPEKEDEVLVVFLQGNQDTGVIIGQFWNGQDKPPTEVKSDRPKAADTDTGGGLSTAKFTDGSMDLAKNDRRLWRSRSGHLIILDDTDGSESVQVWDKSHKLCLAMDSSTGLISLTNNNGDIHIRTKKDLVMEAGQHIKYKAAMNIEGESGMNTKLTVGMNYTMEAKMSVSEKAGMDYKMEAGTTFDVTGKQTTMEGSIEGTYKGGMKGTFSGGVLATVSGAIVKIN